MHINWVQDKVDNRRGKKVSTLVKLPQLTDGTTESTFRFLRLSFQDCKQAKNIICTFIYLLMNFCGCGEEARKRGGGSKM